MAAQDADQIIGLQQRVLQAGAQDLGLLNRRHKGHGAWLAVFSLLSPQAQQGPVSDAGRQRKVAELDDELEVELCGPAWFAELPPSEGPADDYRLLINELMRLMIDRQLFTFVTAAPDRFRRSSASPLYRNAVMYF